MSSKPHSKIFSPPKTRVAPEAEAKKCVNEPAEVVFEMSDNLVQE